MSTKYVHIALATITLIVGLALLIVGFYVDPKGEIHSSVLVAYGESLTFIGSLLGIDYHYRYKHD